MHLRNYMLFRESLNFEMDLNFLQAIAFKNQFLKAAHFNQNVSIAL